MRRDRSAAAPTASFSGRALAALALSLLPAGAALAEVAGETAAASAFTLDAKNGVLLVLAVGAAWGLRVVLRQYQGADKLKVTKRDRLQPNL